VPGDLPSGGEILRKNSDRPGHGVRGDRDTLAQLDDEVRPARGGAAINNAAATSAKASAAGGETCLAVRARWSLFDP
jgi:hypothetical protein